MKKSKAKEPITLAITIPKGWSDLNADQVSVVAHELRICTSPTELALKVATNFAGLMPRGATISDSGERVYHYYHRDKGNIALSIEQVTAIAMAMSWLSVDNVAPMAAPNLDGYVTPDDKLRGVTLEQFITADTAYNAYAVSQDPYPLRVLAAALYAREKYDTEKLQADAQRIGRLDDQLYAVFIWFTGVKVLLTRKFTSVFNSSSGEGDVVNGGDYLLGLLSSLNNGDVTKNEQIKALNIYEALHELNNKIEFATKNG